MDNPRICFVVNAVDQTVAEVDIAVALQRYTDATVDVLAWFGAEPFYGDRYVTVIDLDAPDTTTGINRRTLRAANAVISTCDMVQTTHNHSGAYAKLLARYNGVPAVSREGNTREGFPLLGRIANGLTNPLARAVVCNSQAVWESFARWEKGLLDERNVECIPNGVDFNAIDAGREVEWSVRETVDVETDDLLVGTVGSLTKQKNHETLIRAVRAVRERGVPLELVIAGDGPLRGRLASVAEKEGVADSTHFVGQIDRQEVYKLFHEIDIYSMPSLWEGFSMAAVEAAGSGTVCVFADIEPFRGAYDGVAKFHAPTDVNELADRLAELATNTGQRARLGRAGRALVEESYTIQAVAQQYRTLYETVMS